MVTNALSRTSRSTFIAALLRSACSCFADRAQTLSASTAADEAAIAEFNRKYLKAINDGDIETLASSHDRRSHDDLVRRSAARGQEGARRRDDARVSEQQVQRELGASRRPWCPATSPISAARSSSRRRRRPVATCHAPPATFCASTARSTALGSWCATRSTAHSRAIVNERGLVARLELLAHERHDGRAGLSAPGRTSYRRT